MSYDSLSSPVFKFMASPVISILWYIQMSFLLLECEDVFQMFNLKIKNSSKYSVFKHFCPISAAITEWNMVKTAPYLSVLSNCSGKETPARRMQKHLKPMVRNGVGSFGKVEHLEVAFYVAWLDKTAHSMA